MDGVIFGYEQVVDVRTVEPDHAEVSAELFLLVAPVLSLEGRVSGLKDTVASCHSSYHRPGA